MSDSSPVVPDDKTKEGVSFTESTAARDLRLRMESGNAREFGSGFSDPSEVQAQFATETTDTSDYIGVSEEYMTHANDTEKPYAAEEGAELEALELQTSGLAVQKPAEPAESKTTLGTGSSAESIYTASSGENFSSELVDPEDAVEKKDDGPLGEKAEPVVEEKVQTPSTPAAPVSGGVQSPGPQSTNQ